MKTIENRVARKAVAIATLACMVSTQSAFAAPLVLSQQPLYVGSSVTPKVMLTLSKDQQLFKKAYNDYSDLDGDGVLETTYKHSIDYYGYFDPKKCYIYRNSRFEPERVTEDKYCGGTDEWAGNFLNWVSMSRMDAVRKLLYGGTRSTDGAFTGDANSVVTVLERAYIPTDAHAWAKYYDGADIPQLAPFAIGTGSSNVKLTTTTYPATLTQTFSIPTGNTERDLKFSTSQSSSFSVGDQIRLTNASGSMVGAVMDITNAGRDVRLRIDPKGYVGTPTASTTWDVTNLSRTGISFCNVTPGLGSITGTALSGRRQVFNQPSTASDSRGARQLRALERKRACAVPVGGAQLEPPVGFRRRAQQWKPGGTVRNLFERRESKSLGDRNVELIARVQVCKLRSDGEHGPAGRELPEISQHEHIQTRRSAAEVRRAQ